MTFARQNLFCMLLNAGLYGWHEANNSEAKDTQDTEPLKDFIIFVFLDMGIIQFEWKCADRP